MSETFVLILPAYDNEQEMENIAIQNGGDFDPEYESNITGFIECAMFFKEAVIVTAALVQILSFYEQNYKKEPRVTLIDKGGTKTTNLTIEEALNMINEYKEKDKKNG